MQRWYCVTGRQKRCKWKFSSPDTPPEYIDIYLVKVCWLVTIWKNDLIQNRMFLVRYSLHLLLVVWLNDICCQWWLSGFLIQSKMIFSISSQQHRHHGHGTGTRQMQAANDNKTQSVPGPVQCQLGPRLYTKVQIYLFLTKHILQSFVVFVIILVIWLHVMCYCSCQTSEKCFTAVSGHQVYLCNTTVRVIFLCFLVCLLAKFPWYRM